MKKISAKIKPILCTAACLCLLITFFCMAFTSGEEKVSGDERIMLKVWQIDSFEGGKGSRADYLQSVGNDFTKNGGAYISVTALSSEAARLNLSEGNIPDIISYGAGVYGLEGYISGYKQWCRGGYCILTAEGDFSDITTENTVVNGGRENFTSAALVFAGLNGAETRPSTSAYLKLINGEKKYLFGTQRDIFRLKTRGVAFRVMPFTVYNDLYQIVSVTSSCENPQTANEFINYLLSRKGEVTKLGLISEDAVYEDEMRDMTGIEFDCKLTVPLGEEAHKRLLNLISSGDINSLKNFFN